MKSQRKSGKSVKGEKGQKTPAAKPTANQRPRYALPTAMKASPKSRKSIKSQITTYKIHIHNSLSSNKTNSPKPYKSRSQKSQKSNQFKSFKSSKPLPAIYSSRKSYQGLVLPYQARAMCTENRFDTLCALDIDSEPLPFRQSGVICTIGPASKEVNKLVEMMKAGMNVARMNFSHGTHEYHLETIQNVRQAAAIMAQETNVPVYSVAIALDTKGPEIRTGLLENKKVPEIELKKGKTIKLTTDDEYKEKCTAEVLYLDYKNITKVVKVGSRVFVDDGLISLRVEKVGPEYLMCLIENGGMLGSKKGVNLPGALVDLPAVSEKDRDDLVFGCKNKVDMVFASFIRNGDGVRQIRQILKDNDCEYIKIISKVENHEGVKKIDEIIRESDGIMVARGDMGIEIPAQKVFIAQKMIIAKCNLVGKPVICATQMLESMVKKPRPTRAEVSDVANAILDGADCVMLSGETAKGDYPVETVETMSTIAVEAETMINNKYLFQELMAKTACSGDPIQSAAMGAVLASLKSPIASIVVLSNSGRSAFAVSKFRPRCPIIVITGDDRVVRVSQLYRGIWPCYYTDISPENWYKNPEGCVQAGVNLGKMVGIVKPGDSIVILISAGTTTTMRICQAE